MNENIVNLQHNIDQYMKIAEKELNRAEAAESALYNIAQRAVDWRGEKGTAMGAAMSKCADDVDVIIAQYQKVSKNEFCNFYDI